ncbi:MAG: glycosyltransferase family 2 protein [Gammaproteobacteria bacterium]
MNVYFEQIGAAASFLGSIPFEHTLRGRSVDSLLTRLSTERNLFRDIDWHEGNAPRFRLLLALGEQSNSRQVADTLRCWALQSFPGCEAAIVAKGAAADGRLHEELASDSVFSTFAWRIAEDTHGEWLTAEPGTFLLFARPGDLLHPSLAATLALRMRRSSRDVLAWNCGRYVKTADGTLRLAALLRRPQRQQVTLLNHDYIGRAFAVRASLVEEFNNGSIEDLWGEGGHTLKISLAVNARNRWETHPEYLVLFPEEDMQASGTASRTGLSPRGELIKSLIGGPLEELGASSEAPRWQPARRAHSVSVIIPFRDRPDLTLRALASVCAQRFDGELEIVLVNNQSSQASLARLDVGMGNFAGNLRILRVDYAKAFNHSRQCNLGAQAARGEVVVFLNNDAEFVSPDLVDGMSRWSMLGGIATVGCRIESHAGVLVCAGLKARLNAGCDYHSVLEENRDPEYSRIVREVVGNTLACAAVRRDTFLQLGGLDESDFPIGYNDVEFCLRAMQMNYRHLYLGHLVLRHEPGTSRGKSDELFQKILIRERYPWVIREGMFQLENDRHLLGGIHKTVAQSGGSVHSSSSTGFGNLLRRTLGRFAG